MIWVIKGWKNLPAHCLFLEESTSSPSSSRSAGLFCCHISFLIIPDNYKYVRRRAVWLKWHGDASHPLSLSISSQCSRLMELLIGENPGFLDARLSCGRLLWGESTPSLSLAAQRRVALLLLFLTVDKYRCTQPPCFLLGFLYILSH